MSENVIKMIYFLVEGGFLLTCIELVLLGWMRAEDFKCFSVRWCTYFVSCITLCMLTTITTVYLMFCSYTTVSFTPLMVCWMLEIIPSVVCVASYLSMERDFKNEQSKTAETA